MSETEQTKHIPELKFAEVNPEDFKELEGYRDLFEEMHKVKDRFCSEISQLGSKFGVTVVADAYFKLEKVKGD